MPREFLVSKSITHKPCYQCFGESFEPVGDLDGRCRNCGYVQVLNTVTWQDDLPDTLDTCNRCAKYKTPHWYREGLFAGWYCPSCEKCVTGSWAVWEDSEHRTRTACHCEMTQAKADTASGVIEFVRLKRYFPENRESKWSETELQIGSDGHPTGDLDRWIDLKSWDFVTDDSKVRAELLSHYNPDEPKSMTRVLGLTKHAINKARVRSDFLWDLRSAYIDSYQNATSFWRLVQKFYIEAGK